MTPQPSALAAVHGWVHSYDDAVAFGPDCPAGWQGKSYPIYDHPSPSTAALREALRNLLSEVDIAIEMKCTIAPGLREVERARTLLAGDSRG